MNHGTITWFCNLIILFFGLSSALAEEILLTVPQPPPGYYSQFFGRSVANVSDHHGDGFDDYIVGQPGHWGNGGYAVGHVHFFSGGPNLYSVPQWTMIGSEWNAQLGWSVTRLGDFNNDGQPDFAASHPGGPNPGVRVFYGGSELDGNWDLQLTTSQEFSRFGGTISGGLDLSGDGHPDLVVAANSDNSGPGQDGRVYIYYGGPEVDFYVDQVLDAPQQGRGFGSSLKLVPDVTGDGEADLLVLNWEPHALLIYAGGADFDPVPVFQLDLPEQPGFPTWGYPDVIIPQVDAGDLDGDGQPEIAISLPLEPGGGQVWILQAGLNLDTQVDAVIHARQDGEYFGRMVNISGDYDGDGILDLLVGSRGAGDGHLSGFLNVFPGGDLQALTPSLIMTDLAGIRRFGASAVSLGDFEGDGDDELLVGSASPYGYIWIIDEFYFDCDDNDVPDWQEGAEDCDGDLVPDSCQVLWRGFDCNENQLIDQCEISQDPTMDCNNNGTLDSCEIADHPAWDCNEDGLLDSCQILADPSLDCDGDGDLDSCQIAQWPVLDCNEDGFIDSCQLAADPDLDCDGDGEFDPCQIAFDPVLDTDLNGVLDHCQFPGRLSLFGDSDYTSHHLVTDQVGLVGPFYLVLNIPESAATITHVELELVIPPELFGVQVDLNPLLGFDADNREQGFSLFFDGIPTDAHGNIEIAQIYPIVAQPEVTGISINIVGNSSNSGSPIFDLPIYTDYQGEDRLITETQSGFLNGAPSDAPLADTALQLAMTNYPNPFNPMTELLFTLPRESQVSLKVFDVKGRLVKTLLDEWLDEGHHREVWNGQDNFGQDVSSGRYFARLMADGVALAHSMTLVR